MEINATNPTTPPPTCKTVRHPKASISGSSETDAGLLPRHQFHAMAKQLSNIPTESQKGQNPHPDLGRE